MQYFFTNSLKAMKFRSSAIPASRESIATDKCAAVNNFVMHNITQGARASMHMNRGGIVDNRQCERYGCSNNLKWSKFSRIKAEVVL